MIYTVTLNPSVDYLVDVDHFEINQVNRTKRDAKYPGGKGINVSRVLKRMGINSIPLGFSGGFTGNYIKDYLAQEGISTKFIEVNGDTRINIKLKSGTETEINGQGPEITSHSYEQLLQMVSQLNMGDTIVLAGSIPQSIPIDVYETVTKMCANQGIMVIVDTSGPSLLNIVKHRPFLIKPNHHELGEIFDTEINTTQQAAHYGKKLIEAGAQHVVVSMAGDGAVLCTKEKVYTSTVPKGKVINSVGAGDSLVAGFVGTFTTTGDILKAFKYGVAAGSATAFSLDLCKKEDIDQLLSQIEVFEEDGEGKE